MIMPLADRDQVDLAALTEAPFIDSPLGYGNRCVVDHAITAAGLERRVAAEVPDIATAADYVRHGLGVSLMMAFAAPSDDRRLRVRPLTGSPLLWTLEVATVMACCPSAALHALLALVDQHVHTAAEAAAADRQPAGCALSPQPGVPPLPAPSCAPDPPQTSLFPMGSTCPCR
ncbi:hypothetical protein GCM10009753_76770 [Streptantibioticus ferralitis]